MRYLFFLIALFFIGNANAQTETRPEVDMKHGFLTPIFYIDGERTNRWRTMIQISPDERASRLFNRGSNVRGAGYVTMGLGAILAGSGFGRRNRDNVSNLLFYGGLGCIAGGVAMYQRGSLWQKRAIQVYNEDSAQSSLRLGPTRDGMGLTLTF